MNQLEAYLVELLQGHLSYNKVPVEVRRQFIPTQAVPCITLDTASINTEKIEPLITETEKAVYTRTINMDVNLWCNTEEERETISSLIMQCFYDEQKGHYKYCTQYHEGTCNTTGQPCTGHETGTSRGDKNQCKAEQLLGYESLATKHGIIHGTLNVEPPRMLDEENEKPPLLRNMFSCTAQCRETVRIGGYPSEGVTFNIEAVSLELDRRNQD